MKYRGILFFLVVVVVAGCADSVNEPLQPMADGSLSPNVEIGSEYVAARAVIVAAGWAAVPAQCSEANLCSEYVELATDLASGNTCGRFIKDGKQIDVCVDAIPDGERLKSISAAVSVKSERPGHPQFKAVRRNEGR